MCSTRKCYIKQLFAEGKVNMDKYNFRCQHQKVQNNELKLDEQHAKNRNQLSGRALKCHFHRVAR